MSNTFQSIKVREIVIHLVFDKLLDSKVADLLHIG